MTTGEDGEVLLELRRELAATVEAFKATLREIADCKSLQVAKDIANTTLGSME